MFVTIITDDYKNITSSNYTECDIMTLSNCTFKENEIDIILPTLLLTIPCDLSFLCLLSLKVCTLIKTLFSNK